MFPRELVEELFSGFCATGLHVLDTLTDRFNGLLIVLTLPFEVIGQDVVEGFSGALPASPCELFELRQSLRLDWQRLHASKVEGRRVDVNFRTPAVPDTLWRRARAIGRMAAERAHDSAAGVSAHSVEED